jgi:hypothetical protein
LRIACGLLKHALDCPWHSFPACAIIGETISKGTALSLTRLPAATPEASLIAGAAVIARIRRVLILALISAAIYPIFMSASASYCAGGVDAEGGFLDAVGRPIDEAPNCVQLTLGPSPLMYLGICLIVLLAIGRVLKAADEPAALRVLDRSAIAVGVLVVAAIVVSQVWFHFVPIADFMSGSAAIFSPFPFGSIDVSTTPMPQP